MIGGLLLGMCVSNERRLFISNVYVMRKGENRRN